MVWKCVLGCRAVWESVGEYVEKCGAMWKSCGGVEKCWERCTKVCFYKLPHISSLTFPSPQHTFPHLTQHF